ncbi:MAG: pyridoxamine 5'-phosphate oxidase family protein [Cyanobacteria bacterium MAG CAR3_bin_5]|nr:pyridoxamine 5'-phosphate oxidase family protein [Cyanobacteria bacterium MAG CAR4_bin_6]MCY4172850.1 pyridoxamine 5'-phosphate oxidase family protein [Cyanobacteria bacterium MAG CAR3_bin_5]MCY4331335.1 pyridoxamine 5'-phosphate oxidase family protein [Cyanobacteria bacterium MAG CAR1_bin_15]
MIDDTVRYATDRAVLCWLATVSEHGTPNVSPKELWRVHDHATVLIADIASGGSVRNLRINPACCVSFVDVFRQKGFKLTGAALVIGRKDDDFEHVSAPLRAVAGNRFPVRNVIAVTVEHVAPILAPSYALHNASEEEMMADAFKAYSVKPIAVGTGTGFPLYGNDGERRGNGGPQGSF